MLCDRDSNDASTGRVLPERVSCMEVKLTESPLTANRMTACPG